MKSIVLFGSGNVATHLYWVISKIEDFKIIQIFNHKENSLEPFRKKVPVTSSISEILPADIYLFSIKDDMISEVAENMEYKDALMLHTSGAVSVDVFSEFNRKGVLYPLQTFSKEKEINFSEIPICIESPTDLLILEKLASSLSEKIFKINSAQRRALHVAAVFVSNFVNYLYSEGAEICKKNELPFEILHPLMMETVKKAINIDPKDGQTGPAIRNDHAVINSHLALLNPQQQEVYSVLTEAIQNLHGKKL